MSCLKVSRKLLPLLAGLLVAAPLHAQLPERARDYPLATRSKTGEIVAPMFNGWIANEDGSTTLIFGFANQNRSQIVDVPLGANNKLEPAEFQGAQPTHFPVYSRRGFVGIQERGAFGVVVPADKAGTEVVWTLTSGGNTYSIPGRATSIAYELSAGIAAAGSLRPAIRLSETGPVSINEVGVYAEPETVKVGEPLTLSAQAQDRGIRVGYADVLPYYDLGSYWVMHQGPAEPVFETQEIPGSVRAANNPIDPSVNPWIDIATEVTFPEPGNYVIRLRVDNFEAPDSQFDNVCCWSNVYYPVTVTP